MVYIVVVTPWSPYGSKRAGNSENCAFANQIPDVFTDTTWYTRWNLRSRVDVPKEQSDGNKINEPRVQLKRGD